MEFHEKLTQLRKQNHMTQEQLAEALFVSRTAVSKWESGRGYPSIDSLKAIAAFFSISIDELLSGRELIAAAEKETAEKVQHLRDVMFGVLDLSVLLLFFLPLFGQQSGERFEQVAMGAVTSMWYVKAGYCGIALITALWGILTLALQNSTNARWTKGKSRGSVALSALGTFAFVLTLQPYAASFTLLCLLLKGALLLKKA